MCQVTPRTDMKHKEYEVTIMQVFPIRSPGLHECALQPMASFLTSENVKPCPRCVSAVQVNLSSTMWAIEVEVWGSHVGQCDIGSAFVGDRAQRVVRKSPWSVSAGMALLFHVKHSDKIPVAPERVVNSCAGCSLECLSRVCLSSCRGAVVRQKLT